MCGGFFSFSDNLLVHFRSAYYLNRHSLTHNEQTTTFTTLVAAGVQLSLQQKQLSYRHKANCLDRFGLY